MEKKFKKTKQKLHEKDTKYKLRQSLEELE